MKNKALWIFYFLVSCSTAPKDLTTDVGTLKEGDRLMGEEFYEEARKQFQRIKTEFPESPLQKEADLKTAATFFDDEAYTSAATAYTEFIKTYPGQPEIPLALYRLGLSYAHQMPSNEWRDARAAEKSMEAFSRLLVDHPQSEYTKEAKEWIVKGEELLAQKTYLVGRFYEKRKEYWPAARRYQQFILKFPEHRMAEEVMARRIRCLQLANKTEGLDQLMKAFQERFPNSQFDSMIKP